MSGLGEIVEASVTGTDGKTPAPTKGYVHIKYKVRILRQFGGAPQDTFLLTQGAEASFKPQDLGSLMFFSGCTSASGSVYEPDVGYFFTLDPACRSRIEELATAAMKQAKPDAGASACKQ